MIAALLTMVLQIPPPRDTRASAAATGSIAGIVTTDEPQPRPLRRARVTLNGGGLEMGRTTITADDGTFAFDGVPPGRFTVAAAKDAYVTMNYGASRPHVPESACRLPSGR